MTARSGTTRDARIRRKRTHEFREAQVDKQCADHGFARHVAPQGREPAIEADRPTTERGMRPETPACWIVYPTLARLRDTGMQPYRSYRRPWNLSLSPFQPPTDLQRRGGIIALVTTKNHRRVIEPVLERLSRSGDLQETVRSQRLASIGVWRYSRIHETADADQLQSEWALGKSQVPLLKSALRHAMRFYNFALNVFNTNQPDWFVSSNQHSLHARAFLAAARTARVPSLYIPHAPFARSLGYADLPATIVALRGEGERDAYLELTGSPGGLEVVGVPYTDLPESRPQRLDEPIALAVSNNGIERIREVISTVVSATGETVTVLPHPGYSGPSLAQEVPDHWVVQDSGIGTAVHLSKGPKAIVVDNSGVFWEALHLGVPAIGLATTTGVQNYPIVDGDVVPIAGSTDELSSLLARWSKNPDRARLSAHARYWGAPVGAEAVEATCELLRRSTHEGGVVFDRCARFWPFGN